MKNARALIMIGISIAVGLGAVFAAAQWVRQQTSMATVKVVVAAKDLDLGTRLNATMLQLVEWPASSKINGAFSDLSKLDSRVINTTILRGEPVLESRLAPEGSKGGLSAVITEGRRAMTVKVNEVVGVAGFALPGNYVDIMVNVPDDKNKTVSKIVLEQILVLAVAQDQVVRDESKAKVVSAVTLEVTPEQAEKLDLARSVGNLSLVLRNQVDRTPTVTTGARTGDLLAGATQAEPKPAPVTAAKPADTRPAEAPKKVVKAVKPVAARPAETKQGIELIRGINRSSIESDKAE